jgi:cellulose synthase/poly-beta-1,6-N-acetylglucosamine synthase-like glycosyltransferase
MSLLREARPTIRGTPFISVIVPVRNEAPCIRTTLLQLLDQDYPAGRFEIIVVDGQSTDGTPAIVRDIQIYHGNLRLLNNGKRWSSAGRNLGIEAARGDHVVIVDGHCDLANPRYLRDLADTFARSGADCVGRPQPQGAPGMSVVQRAISFARASWLGHHPASHVYSSACRFVRPQSVAVAYCRSVFEVVGRFDEHFDACEDVEFNHRVDQAGLTCYFSPQLRVSYRPRAGLAGLCKQMIRYGRGRVRLLRKHPNTLSLPGLLPGIFLVCVLAGILAAGLSPILASAYAMALACYGLVVMGTALAIAWRARAGHLLLWLPAVFVAIHCAAGLGILLEMLAGGTGRAGAGARAPHFRESS